MALNWCFAFFDSSKIKLPASYRQVKLCPRRDVLHITWRGIRIKRFDESLTNSLLDESWYAPGQWIFYSEPLSQQCICQSSHWIYIRPPRKTGEAISVNDSQNSSTNGLTHCWTGCFLEEGSTNSSWKASHWTFWDSWVNVKIRYCYNLIVRIYVILR